MGDVSPGAVAGEEDSTKVGVVVQPRLGSLAGGVSGGPHKSLPRVVVRDGDRVLRAQPVVDRDSDDVGLRDEGNEVGVVERGEGGFDAETAAVDVKEEREVAVGGGSRREVETGGDTCFRRNDDVFGYDAVLRDIGRRDGFCPGDSLYDTTFEYSEHG